MANELPEVVPSVQSMPTSGWFVQTGGSARMLVGECNQGRTHKGFIQACVISAFNSATQRSVTYNTYVNTSFANCRGTDTAVNLQPAKLAEDASTDCR